MYYEFIWFYLIASNDDGRNDAIFRIIRYPDSSMSDVCCFSATYLDRESIHDWSILNQSQLW